MCAIITTVMSRGSRAKGNAAYYTIIASIIIVGAVLGYMIYTQPNQEKNQEKSKPEIGSWSVYINDKKSSVIHTKTQEDGTATWNGNITVNVLDQFEKPLKDVKVILDGCGITSANVTDTNGTARFSVSNVTLESGISVGYIQLWLRYDKLSAPQIKQDSITVVRS